MKTFLYHLLVIYLVLLAGCTYTTKITDGKTAIERKQYSVAIPFLKTEFRKAKRRTDKGKIANNIANAYTRLGKDDEAIEWYSVAYSNGVGIQALKGKAAAQKRLELYDDAIGTYTELGLEIGSKYEFRTDILGAELAQGWLAEPEKAYSVALANFNTPQSDYTATEYEGEQLIVVSDRKGVQGDNTYAWTGGNFSDLFVVNTLTGAVEGFGSTINSVHHEGPATFSADFQLMIFNRCSAAKGEDAYCGLYSVQRQGERWGEPKPLTFMEAAVNYLHPTLSADGKTLYFSAKMEDGWGGYDLFVTTLDEQGEWSTPKMLGRGINTRGNEQFPYLDGDTLYFSSDGHLGMGGLDIFKTYPLSNGNWSSPENLKPPLNSGADDFGIVVQRKQDRLEGVIATGYFSSTRSGGKGKEDIYKFKERPLPPPTVEEDKPIVYRNILDVYVVTKIYSDPSDPNSKVLGKSPLPNTQLLVWTGKNEKSLKTDEEGKLSLILRDDKDYRFRASEEGYLSSEEQFTSVGISKDPNHPERRYELEIELDRIFENKEIVLENIYYDFNESFIREDAKPSLDQLVDILQLNPDINIELGSHTDCRGGETYNQELSQRRAAAAVQYVIDKGISPARLVPKGYGESVPSTACKCNQCTEEEHQQNRRTTFRILTK